MLPIYRFSLGLLLLFLLQACQQQTTMHLEHLAEKNKKNDAAVYNTELGIAYLKQGDRVRAKKKLLTALVLAPKSPDTNAAMAYFLEKTGDLNESRAYYKKALAYAPASGAQLNNYGAFLCRQADYKEAERYFLRAVKDVNYLYTAGAYENAGLCAAATADYPKAQAYFLKALKQDPKRKQSLYELIKIEIEQNNAKEALIHIQQFPELSLNDLSLLQLAVKAAKIAGKTNTEANYKKRLSALNNLTDPTGVDNEYDSYSG